MTNLTGFVNIIKPTGMTSSDVVLRVKKTLKTKKVGHLGTLDPAASGVLPIAVGKATKFFDYFLNKDKEYVAIVKFGVETDTLDSFGNITKVTSKEISESDILDVLYNFIGEIDQVPPKYSAIKINGKKACDLARDNIEFEIQPKKIKIYNIELLKDLGDNKFLFKVNCSAGTYIRTLFSDIAKNLETVSTTPVIIRTESGRFKSENAFTLDEFENTKTLLKIEEVFNELNIIDVEGDLAKKLINGVKVKTSDIDENLQENQECLVSYQDKLIGFYRVQNRVLLQIVYLFEEWLW